MFFQTLKVRKTVKPPNWYCNKTESEFGNTMKDRKKELIYKADFYVNTKQEEAVHIVQFWHARKSDFLIEQNCSSESGTRKSFF
ncbi:hypothetical protein SUGI_1014520 [Cryptomeria japonica]|nr:hypothetical protein SUGI_1014520 [Cryptomeria japonica]